MHKLFFLLLLFPALCLSQDTLKTKYFDVACKKYKVEEVFHEGRRIPDVFGYEMFFYNVKKKDSVTILGVYVKENGKGHSLYCNKVILGKSYYDIPEFLLKGSNLSTQESETYGNSTAKLSSFPGKYKHYKGNCIIVYEVKGKRKYLLIKKLKEIPTPPPFNPPLDEHLLH